MIFMFVIFPTKQLSFVSKGMNLYEIILFISTLSFSLNVICCVPVVCFSLLHEQSNNIENNSMNFIRLSLCYNS